MRRRIPILHPPGGTPIMSNTRTACTTNNPDRHLNGAWRPHNGKFPPHCSAMAWLAACPVFVGSLPARLAACLPGSLPAGSLPACPACCLPGSLPARLAACPACCLPGSLPARPAACPARCLPGSLPARLAACPARCLPGSRSEEHTSELQSRRDLVCRLLLEKKKNNLSQPFSCSQKHTNLSQ